MSYLSFGLTTASLPCHYSCTCIIIANSLTAPIAISRSLCSRYRMSQACVLIFVFPQSCCCHYLYCWNVRCTLLCHVALQVLLSSTSQIDKAYNYRFLWPWLGSGLLTSTGRVIEQHSITVSVVTEPHCVTVSMVTETYSSTVRNVIEKHSFTVSKPMANILLLFVWRLNGMCYCSFGDSDTFCWC